MTALFLTCLDVELIEDKVWCLTKDLIYQSDIVGRIVIPAGFITDFASVPRVPIAFMAWGDRVHREAVVHDFLYRRDCPVDVPREVADRVFLEAMECRNKPFYVRYPMYWGVRMGGASSWKKRHILECDWRGL